MILFSLSSSLLLALGMVPAKLGRRNASWALTTSQVGSGSCFATRRRHGGDGDDVRSPMGLGKRVIADTWRTRIGGEEAV